MKRISLLLLICIFASSVAFAQKRKKQAPAPRPRERAVQPRTIAPRIIGSKVVIVTKSDDRITGTLLDLTAYSVRIRADNLESTIALDTIASISFGQASPPVAQPVSVPARADFLREADTAVNSFQSLATQLKSNTD